MRKLDDYLKNRIVNKRKLLEYGFVLDGDVYKYEHSLDENFLLEVNFSNDRMISRVIDLDINEEYLLIDTNNSGKFLGDLRDKYDFRIKDIIDNCSEMDPFNSSQTRDVICYVKSKYGDELEFLWEKFSNNAVFRHGDNRKWYALILSITADKIGLASNDIIEVINLRGKAIDIDKLVDNVNYFRGYHMNKKYWFTIKLDYSVSNDTIFKLIDESYNMK